MDELEAMKGPGELLLAVRRRGHDFRLFRFPDGSFSIHQDGLSVGLWEPRQERACIVKLAQLMGLTAFSAPAGIDSIRYN